MNTNIHLNYRDDDSLHVASAHRSEENPEILGWFFCKSPEVFFVCVCMCVFKSLDGFTVSKISKTDTIKFWWFHVLPCILPSGVWETVNTRSDCECTLDLKYKIDVVLAGTYTQQKMKGENGWFGTSLFQLLSWEAEISKEWSRRLCRCLQVVNYCSTSLRGSIQGNRNRSSFLHSGMSSSTNVTESAATWSNKDYFSCKSKNLDRKLCKQREWILWV